MLININKLFIDQFSNIIRMLFSVAFSSLYAFCVCAISSLTYLDEFSLISIFISIFYAFFYFFHVTQIDLLLFSQMIDLFIFIQTFLLIQIFIFYVFYLSFTSFPSFPSFSSIFELIGSLIIPEGFFVFIFLFALLAKTIFLRFNRCPLACLYFI